MCSNLRNELVDRVRNYDYDRYIIGLFFSNNLRMAWYSLLAFNLEVAKTSEVTSEQITGKIRFQWWREALEELASNNDRPSKKHEVITALRENNLIDKDNLALVLSLINSRERDLDGFSFKDMQEMEDYAKNTVYPLNNIACNADFALEDSSNTDEVESILVSLSKAWGLIGLTRSAFNLIPLGKNPFPESLMQKHNVSLDNYGSEEFLKNSTELIREIIKEAENKLIMASGNASILTRKVRKKLNPILLQISIAKNHIKRIKKLNYNVFDSVPIVSNAGTILKLYERTLRLSY